VAFSTNQPARKGSAKAITNQWWLVVIGRRRREKGALRARARRRAPRLADDEVGSVGWSLSSTDPKTIGRTVTRRAATQRNRSQP